MASHSHTNCPRTAEEEWHAEEWGSPEATGCDPPLHPLEECGGGTR